MKTIEQSVIKFVYFTANFKHDFIEQCWANDEYLIKHLNDKFADKAQNGVINSGAFLKFFFDLDNGNQIRLVRWINENYNG